MQIDDVLKNLYRSNRINKQQYRTYKGQVSSGNTKACLVGLMRKKLISADDAAKVSAEY